MKNFTQPGLVPDERTEEQKAKDYQLKETIPMAVVLKWNRGLENAPAYSNRNQNGSGSCVGQSVAKALETLKKEVISAHPVYRRRFNYPQVGMWLQNAGDIVRKLGTTTEILSPSQNMTEEQMSKSVDVETPISNYIYAFPDFKNIDEIATAIELYKHCIITVGAEYGEWNLKPIYNGKLANMYHAICGTYYFTDENGEKCIRIDESWGQDNPEHRILTESYLKLRGTGAMYLIPPVELPDDDKPKHTFNSYLRFGDNNFSVKMLQDILKYEKLFPINITSTGYYGNITAKSVLAFQRKYNVASEGELNQLQGKICGPKTIKKLNELYS